MFHVTSIMLACLARRRARLAADHYLAPVCGWQFEQVTPGTYRYRDPRFDQFKDRS